MIRIHSLLPLFGLAPILTACNGPKSISKRAGELYAAGFNEQAANLYTMALRKKPGYVDAMVGLEMTGQGVMDIHIGEFQRAALSGRRADAIAEYDKMMAFKAKVAAVGVVLLVPATVEADHADSSTSTSSSWMRLDTPNSKRKISKRPRPRSRRSSASTPPTGMRPTC